MAIDFTKFDNSADLDALQEEVKNAKDNEFTDVPDGDYVVGIDKMEIKTTKAGDKLMFAVQCGIKEGQNRGRKIFFNRIISGNRTTERWSDGAAIKSVCTWVNKLLTADDEPLTFINYSDFAGQILDIFQTVAGYVELDVTYKADAFNPITIKEVYEL